MYDNYFLIQIVIIKFFSYSSLISLMSFNKKFVILFFIILLLIFYYIFRYYFYYYIYHIVIIYWNVLCIELLQLQYSSNINQILF